MADVSSEIRIVLLAGPDCAAGSDTTSRARPADSVEQRAPAGAAHIMRDRGGQGDSVAPRCIESALITYEELAGRMGWTVPIAVRWPLGIVGTYCCENDLPSLSSMVVKKRTGKPGKGVILREGRTCRDEQRGVVQTDWFMYRVPTIETFDVTISLMEVTRSIGLPFPGSASFAGGPAHAQSRSRT